MAEVLGVAASIIAVLQASEAVIQICKGYIESVKNYPSDLRRVLLEISSLKGVFENLQFLHDSDLETSQLLTNIIAKDGAIEGCRRVVLELQRQFPASEESVTTTTEQRSSKRRKIKDGLERLAWPFKENKVRGLLNELDQYKSTITTAFSAELVQDVKHMHRKVQDIGKTIDEASKNNFRQWLWRNNPSSNHNSACRQHEPGTCEWVLQLPQWANWLNQDLRCLWIHGIPGAGKTVLFSQLVAAIESHVATIDEAAPFLRWVLGQLSKQADTVPEIIYTNYQNGYEPTIGQLLAAIKDILSCFDVVFISLDAIDESQPRNLLLTTIAEFMSDPHFSKLQLLATSREYADIQSTMRNLLSSYPISMANESLRSDIQVYVMRTLAEEKPFRFWRMDLRDEVKNSLVVGAKGMFRWVICQIDLLRRMRLASEDDVRTAIISLPATLDETYERIFLLTLEEDRPYLRSALHWIMFLGIFDGIINRFKSLSFLAGLVFPPCERLTSIHANETAWEESLLDICGCLIRCDIDGDVFLAHYTVREFLESSRIVDSPISFFAVDDTKLIEEHWMISLHERPKRRKEQGSYQTTTQYAPKDFSVALALIFHADILETEITDDMIEGQAVFNCLMNFIVSAKFYPPLEIEEYPDILAFDVFPVPPPAVHFWFADMCSRNVDESFISSLGDDEVDPDTFLFISLLLQNMPKVVPKFLSTANRRRLYQQRIAIHIGRPQYKSLYQIQDNMTEHEKPEQDLELTGTVFDILGQIQAIGFWVSTEVYDALCGEGVGLFDLTSNLGAMAEYFYMAAKRGLADNDIFLHIVLIFLQHGANLNSTERSFTVLQLAVAAEADIIMDLINLTDVNLNDVGQGDPYLRESLTELNLFRGQSPLRMCRNIMRERDQNEVVSVIEQDLVKYGARDFFKQPR